MIKNEDDLSEWEKVFILPNGHVKQKTIAGAVLYQVHKFITSQCITECMYCMCEIALLIIIYLQNPAEKSAKFKVLVVKESSALTDFMTCKNISSNERDQIFCELSPSDTGLTLLHYVEIVTIEDSKV